MGGSGLAKSTVKKSLRNQSKSEGDNNKKGIGAQPRFSKCKQVRVWRENDIMNKGLFTSQRSEIH